MAIAAFLGAKKSSPFGPSTRDDTLTFTSLLVGTVVTIGASALLAGGRLRPIGISLGTDTIWRLIYEGCDQRIPARHADVLLGIRKRRL
jgi:hypothetical protein